MEDEDCNAFYIDRILKENAGPRKLTRVTLDGIKQAKSKKAATFDVEPEQVAFLKQA